MRGILNIVQSASLSLSSYLFYLSFCFFFLEMVAKLQFIGMIIQRFTFVEIMKMKNMPQSCHRSRMRARGKMKTRSHLEHCMVFHVTIFRAHIFDAFVSLQIVMSYYVVFCVCVCVSFVFFLLVYMICICTHI